MTSTSTKHVKEVRYNATNMLFLQNIPSKPMHPLKIYNGKRHIDVNASPLTVDPSLRFPIHSRLRMLIQLSLITPVWSFHTRPITKYPTDTHLIKIIPSTARFTARGYLLFLYLGVPFITSNILPCGNISQISKVAFFFFKSCTREISETIYTDLLNQDSEMKACFDYPKPIPSCIFKWHVWLSFVYPLSIQCSEAAKVNQL